MTHGYDTHDDQTLVVKEVVDMEEKQESDQAKHLSEVPIMPPNSSFIISAVDVGSSGFHWVQILELLVHHYPGGITSHQQPRVD